MQLIRKKTVRRGLVVCMFASMMGACATAVLDGPGMIVTYASRIRGKYISIEKASLPDGKPFPHGGAIGRPLSETAPWWQGKTMGAAPDGRQLPDWVEFSWAEPVYPEDPKQTLEQYRALPRKTQRVMVRERVPQEVVEEVVRSRRAAPNGKLPDTMLYIYFVWTDDGVKFYWRLEGTNSRGGTELRRSGGDAIV
jgi:hypothetical protein